MKIKLVSMIMLMGALVAGVNSAALGRDAPVAKLVQVTGEVSYTRNGKTWRPVRRTKYLFAGYEIKTGSDGGGKLINQQSGMSQDLGPNSQIRVTDSSVALVAGSLSRPKEESTSIWQGLANKFAKAQRYTTVRRGAKADDGVCDSKVRTIRDVTLSEAHPDLVWRNACPEFSYRLIIDGAATYEIPAQSNSEMIRFAVQGVDVGEHTYRVEVLDKDGIVYSPNKVSKFTWIDNREQKDIASNVERMGDDVFQAAELLESKNMHVAAMDSYRSYFADNPDDNDMRPLLIQSYNALKLVDLRENEARLYNASLEEDH